jgi:hypothetical protein
MKHSITVKITSIRKIGFDVIFDTIRWYLIGVNNVTQVKPAKRKRCHWKKDGLCYISECGYAFAYTNTYCRHCGGKVKMIKEIKK